MWFGAFVSAIISYYLWQRREERWRNWPEDDRTTNFVMFFPVFERPLRIRKSFSYGIPATFFEKLMEASDRKDPSIMDRFEAKALRESPVYPLSWIPDVVRPELEILANKDFYFQRPVYPEKGDPEYQYWPWTSESAKAAGHVVGVSPAKIEHVLSRYSGGVSVPALQATDWMARVAAGAPEVPPVESQPADYPLLGRFVGRTGTLSSASSNKFYELLKEGTAAYQTAKKLQVEDPVQMRSYLVQNHDRLRAYMILSKAAESLDEKRKRFNSVREGPLGTSRKTAEMASIKADFDRIVGNALNRLGPGTSGAVANR